MLSVSPLFDFNEISFDKESEVHLDVILTAPEKSDSKRIPLHLILAIDCSGSMDNGKLDAVKKTTEKLIDHLTENDTLGIVGFSKDVWAVFKPLPMKKESKDQAKSAVKKLRTLGATNLSGAITLAMEYAVISDTSKISRIILLTDGLPSEGICDKAQLVEMTSKMNPSVSMSTFGYGADFDAELMASISSVGRGSSFYIKTDEDCNKAFAMELGGLLSLFGQNIKMTITPSVNFEFKELLSEYKCQQKQGYRLLTSQKIEVQIDDVFAGEKKHVVLKLATPKATEADCGRDTQACSIEITYNLAGSTNIETINLNGVVQYVSPDKAPKDPNEDVRKQLLVLEAAKIQKEAQDKADQGHYAEARGLLSKGLSFVSANAVHMADAASVTTMFENLSENYSDANTYRMKGSKLSASYRCSMITGRSTSSDTMGLMNNVQAQMLSSFSGTTTDPGVISVLPITTSTSMPIVKDEEGKV